VGTTSATGIRQLHADFHYSCIIVINDQECAQIEKSSTEREHVVSLPEKTNSTRISSIRRNFSFIPL